MNLCRYKEFEAIKWYHKGKFEIETDPVKNQPTMGSPEFKINDKILLINKEKSYWSGFNFRDSVRMKGETMVVSRNYLMTIEGHLCVCCYGSGWYKVDCIRKIENEYEAIKWYHKGKFEIETDPVNNNNNNNKFFKIGDYIKVKKTVQWWNGVSWQYYGGTVSKIIDMKLSEEINKEDYDGYRWEKELPPIEFGKYYYKFSGKWAWFKFDENDAEIIDPY
jgi:hypothetical protein